jgi:phage-related minor tail protein
MAETKYPLSLIIRAVDGVTKPLEKINARLEKTGAALSAPFAKLGNSIGALGRAAGVPALADSFGRARDAAGNLGQKAAGLVGTFAGLAAAGAFGFTAIVRSAEEAGSRLNDMSTRTGLSVQAFAELEFAAKKAGVGGESFAGGMEKFNKGLSEARRGAGPLAELLKKVGPVYLQQLKSAKSNEEAFTLLAKAMQKVENPGRRAELAAAAFGRAGVGMVNVLKDGPEGVAQLRAEFLKLAGDQTAFAKNSDALGDSFDALETSLLGVRNVAVGALMPAITRLTEIVTGFVVKNRDGIQQWAERTGAAIQKWIDGGGVDRLVAGLGRLIDTASGLIDKVGGMENALKLVALAMAGPTLIAAGQFGIALVSLTANVVAFGARLGGLQLATWAADWVKYLWMMRGSIMAGLIPSLTAATASVWSFTAALLANPITWVVIAVATLAGAVYLVYRNWDGIAAFFWGRWDAVTKVFSGFLSWVGENLSWTPLGMLVNNWEPVKAFFSGLWDSITAIFRGGWETISPIIDKMMNVAQFIPGLGGAAGVVNGARSLFGGEGAAPTLGAASALPPSRASETKVQVDFANVPRGVRVTPTQQAPEFELNLGLAMAPGT